MSARYRRLRKSETIRAMVREVRVGVEELVYPMFITFGTDVKEEIGAMPGQYRYSIDKAVEAIDEIKKVGIKSILLFGIPEEKDACGCGAYHSDGIVQQAVREIKKAHSEILVITDVCMCEYTSHGHCGILKDGTVDNDETLKYLAMTAVSHAEAGADIIAPSDMMDMRVGFIRDALDKAGFEDIPIMSYSVKYASSFYGPFREAAGSAPGFGDRKGYQMDYKRKREALLEAEADIEEGADILMVKPALSYLDVISEVRRKTDLPVAAYNVSGEYSMVKSAAANGFIDEIGVVSEILHGIKRAGADIIITYHAVEFAKWRAEGKI